jgi:hypothetical protein
MKQSTRLAAAGVAVLALAAGSAMAQSGGGGGGPKESGEPDTTGASAVHHKGMTHAKSHGTTLHQEDKASHLKGGAAAKAASGLGTNDKGQAN